VAYLDILHVFIQISDLVVFFFDQVLFLVVFESDLIDI